MGFLKNLWSPEPSAVVNHDLEQVIVAEILQQGTGSLENAMAVAAVFRARQLNADTPASLEVKVGDSLVPAPNIDQTVQEFVVEAILAMQDHGDLYVGVRDGEMWVVKNDHITVKWDDSGRFRRYYNTETGIRYRLTGPARNLIVVSMNRGVEDLTGMGWMESKRLQGIIAEQAWSQEYFENNASPVGVLSVPGVMTAEEAQRLKEQWINQRTKRTPAVVSAGAQWQDTSFSATDSEWTQTHLVGIGDVSALSGVPSNFLAYSPPGSTLTYQNVSDLWRIYWTQTLKVTYVSRLEAMWTSVLGQTVRFDPEPLLISSMKDRVWSATELVRTGFDPAEALDQVGMPPIPHTGEIPVTLQTDRTTT